MDRTMSFIRELPHDRVVGFGEAMQGVEREVLLAASGDAHVLITGERGFGKAAVARFIHEHSDRSPQGFAVIRCQGLPDQLFESELFGHAKGSFPGAYRDKPGLLELVRGGTVFLDEVGALHAKAQTSLQRFLETGECLRIGTDHIQVRPRVRVIASTTANLPARVAAGLFRGDLYRQLNGACLTVPAVRELQDAVERHLLSSASGPRAESTRQHVLI